MAIPGVQSGKRPFTGRDPDLRRGQLDSPDRDRGRVVDGDKTVDELIAGRVWALQHDAFPACLERNATELGPEPQGCRQCVGARLQGYGDRSLSRIALKNTLQEGSPTDLLRSDVHRATATFPGVQLGKAGELRMKLS